MKTAWYERQGPPREVLIVGETPDPAPGPGELRIRVAASGINPGDTNKREDKFDIGMAYPRVIPHSGRSTWSAKVCRRTGSESACGASAYSLVGHLDCVKLPIGLMMLAIAGLALFGVRQLPREWEVACGVLVVGLVSFLTVMATGNTDANIRHALPAVVLLAASRAWRSICLNFEAEALARISGIDPGLRGYLCFPGSAAMEVLP